MKPVSKATTGPGGSTAASAYEAFLVHHEMLKAPRSLSLEKAEFNSPATALPEAASQPPDPHSRLCYEQQPRQ